MTEDSADETEQKDRINMLRRGVLRATGALAVGTAAAGAGSAQSNGRGPGNGPGNGGGTDSQIRERTQNEFDIRKAYSKEHLIKDIDTTPHPRNDRISEEVVISKYGKALPHDPETGLPSNEGYNKIVEAVESGEGYEDIPQASEISRPYVQPESGWTYQSDGRSTAELRIAQPPAFTSDEAGAEMVELYWRALTRDVNFRDYDDNELVQAAADELNSIAGYNGPGSDSEVTTSNVFRGVTPGNEQGPYISQFLWKDRNLGRGRVNQKIQPQSSENSPLDYVTDVEHWKKIQNGIPPEADDDLPENERADTPRHIITARDMCERVHSDPPFKQCRKAAEVLLSNTNTPLDDGLPWIRPGGEGFLGQTTHPFNDFGPLYVEKKVVEASEQGQLAAWHKKWNVHRKLRPEEYGGRVEAAVGDKLEEPDGVDLQEYIPDNLLSSKALEYTYKNYGSHLLPQGYAEGSPTHTSYPAGHSVVAGAGATVLKLLFDTDYEFSDEEKVVPTRDGSELVTAAETRGNPLNINDTLTVRGELNKLMSNMALGRNRAGIHYRTDGIEGIRLGEAAAITMMEDELARTRNHGDLSLSMVTVDGEEITIGPTV